MRHFYDVVLNSAGTPLSGASVLVYLTGTTTKPTIYSDDGVTPTANPVTTDAYGRFGFYVADGRYDLVASWSTATYTLSDIEISDVTEGGSADLAWQVGNGLRFKGSTSGNITVIAAAVAGTNTLTLPAATDTLVGKATTDTLTNKTLTAPVITTPTITTPTVTTPTISGTLTGSSLSQTNTSFIGASNGNNLTLLNAQGVLSPLTGNAADQTYYTYTLPANTLGAGKGLRITVYVTHSTGTASVSMKLSFGGTFTSALGGMDGAGARGKLVYEVFNNAGVTNAQTIGSIAQYQGGATSIATIVDTASVTTTSGVTINLTFNVAGTDALTPRLLLIELIQ